MKIDDPLKLPGVIEQFNLIGGGDVDYFHHPTSTGLTENWLLLFWPFADFFFLAIFLHLLKKTM